MSTQNVNVARFARILDFEVLWLFYRIRHQVWYNGQWYTLCIDRNAFLIYRCRQNKKIGRHLGTFEKKVRPSKKIVKMVNLKLGMLKRIFHGWFNELKRCRQTANLTVMRRVKTDAKNILIFSYVHNVWNSLNKSHFKTLIILYINVSFPKTSLAIFARP